MKTFNVTLSYKFKSDAHEFEFLNFLNNYLKSITENEFKETFNYKESFGVGEFLGKLNYEFKSPKDFFKTFLESENLKKKTSKKFTVFTSELKAQEYFETFFFDLFRKMSNYLENESYLTVNTNEKTCTVKKIEDKVISII